MLKKTNFPCGLFVHVNYMYVVVHVRIFIARYS